MKRALFLVCTPQRTFCIRAGRARLSQAQRRHRPTETSGSDWRRSGRAATAVRPARSSVGRAFLTQDINQNFESATAGAPFAGVSIRLHARKTWTSTLFVPSERPSVLGCHSNQSLLRHEQILALRENGDCAAPAANQLLASLQSINSTALRRYKTALNQCLRNRPNARPPTGRYCCVTTFLGMGCPGLHF